MTPTYLSKKDEMILLIRRIFPTPYSGSAGSGLALFKICRELGSLYCNQFDENGYTKEYATFDSENIVNEVARLLTDELLFSYSRKYKDSLSGYTDFFGRFYTYEGHSRELTIGSKWEEIRDYLTSLISSTPECVKCVLKAFVEVSKSGIYDSYWPIFTLSKEYGLGKGWWKILSKLQLKKVIGEDYRHMNIQEELLPLIAEIVGE